MRLDAQQHFTPEFLPSLLHPILKRNRFDGSVAVVPVPSVDQTRWLLAHALEYDFIQGVVGWADLHDPHLPAVLDEYQRHPKFRGVRWWFDGGLPPALDEVARRHLTLDVAAGFSPAIPEAFPHLPIVAGDWSTVPLDCARYPNLYVKVAGLITSSPGRWKAADFAAGVRALLAAFGPERIMYGSDWPAYLPEGTWKEALAAFTQSIGAQTLETRELLLGATARRFYGLET
ncbi:MAG: amidohydrolase family protein [Candidatus Solibacter sp.]